MRKWRTAAGQRKYEQELTEEIPTQENPRPSNGPVLPKIKLKLSAPEKKIH
jgi:hypothetical protein